MGEPSTYPFRVASRRGHADGTQLLQHAQKAAADHGVSVAVEMTSRSHESPLWPAVRAAPGC